MSNTNRKINKLQEKAGIDWNNYLTPEEVKKFLSKDDKIESAENIIYDTKGNFFNKYWKDFKKSGWTKQELVKDLENFYTNGHLITEGIHLVAYVRSPYKPGVQAIEDSDYASKTDFAKDLRANEFTVLSVNDNRDLYVVDNSDFGNLAQLKKKMKFYKMMWDDAKKENPESTLFKDDYERLKKIYDEAMKQPLNENYVLKGIQDGKSFDISYNDDKEKLQKFKNELQKSHKNIGMYIVEESKKIEALKPIKKGQMKILNIGGDGIAYKVSMQDAARLQNAGYQIFLPQGNRKSIYARAGDIEDYNNGFNVDGEKLQENLKDIVLYHGSSNTNLTYLDIGKSTGNGDQLGRGIYLTTDYEQAQSYAGNSGKVYKVKLDDSLKLFNLNDKLSDSIKQQLIKELENSNNKDIKNYICMFNRKVYDVKDKQEGLKFYQDKQKEWEQLDNKYFGNRPKVVKNGNNLQVIYTDYSDIQSAINNMTGENLIDTLRGDIDPDVFVTIITNSGYDGVITNNNHWYVIYRDINKVHILNENRNFGNKNKLEEVSRNELLVKAKGETITRYNKAAGYKGFSIVNIDTSDLLHGNILTITCRVGKYNDVLQLEDVLYWIQIVAENKQQNQINTKGITEALSDSIDGMDIKVNCDCGDFTYRFAYEATVWGYKYGKPETRPADIRNPDGYGSLCFSGNTLVLTENGFKAIKDIKVGDKVFTHKGRLKKVTETSNHKVDNVVDVVVGNKHIQCTDNHPFLNCTSNGNNFQFCSVKDINKNAKIVSPILKLDDVENIDTNFAFILGYYLANGSLSYRTDCLPKKVLTSNIKLAVSSDYAGVIKTILTNMGITYSYKENSNDKSSYISLKADNNIGKNLKDFIVKYGNFNYKDEETKKISCDVLNWNKEAKLALIQGFFAGDGQYGSSNKYLNMRFLNTNKNIIDMLNILLRSFGIHTKVIKFKRKPRYVYNNTKESNAKDMYCITVCGQDILKIDNDIFKQIKGKQSYSYPISNYKARVVNNEDVSYFMTSIKSIEPIDSMVVYNIGVEDDDSYLVTTDLFAVHNCKHLISMLSNKKWLQQVTGTVMDWCTKNIDKINEFLKLTDEDKKLTLPNELARQNAKKGFYSKLFNKDDEDEEQDSESTETDLEDVDKDTGDTDISDNTANNKNTDSIEDETELEDTDEEK